MCSHLYYNVENHVSGAWLNFADQAYVNSRFEESFNENIE
jgi:hypothetical protein